ncbi:hypothetical protein SprV_0401462600 [Sparganum proliferum]
MSLDLFEERLHTASFVSHRMVAVKTEKLCGARCLPINRRFKFTVKVSSDKHIQERQLLFLFFFPRPKATMRNKVMKIKDPLKPEEQSGVVYRIPCQNCPCNYTGQTGRMLGSRIHEHKLAVRQGDALSQFAAHTYEMDHEFPFAATKIVANTGNKTGRELIEAWASEETRSIDLSIWRRRTEPSLVTSSLAPSVEDWLTCLITVACSVAATTSDDGLLYESESSGQ